MTKFESFLLHLFGFIVSVFVGFVDLVNYYPAGKPEGMAFYGDGTYISFSCFNFLVVYILFEIMIVLYYGSNEND